MHYPFSTPSPYIQAAMSQAVQAMLLGGTLPPNCVILALPYQQAQQILPQLMMNPGLGPGTAGDPMIFSQPAPYYGATPYATNPPPHGLPPPPHNYNYPIVPYKSSKKNGFHPQQPHSNIYNSSSFDSYMDNLSWSRLFDRPSRKTGKQENSDKKSVTPTKKSRSNSTTSSSSTASDETIRRVNVVNNTNTNNNKQSSTNTNSKQQTKGSLPFKYSSEFIPGLGKQQQQQQSQKIKSNDVFIIKKQ